MPDGLESQEVARHDGSSAHEAEITRLTLYADAQERKTSELQVTVSQLQHALDSRVVIDRATGMLSERFDLSIADAFELLRSAARSGRREVRTLASEVTESRAQTPADIAEAFARRGRS